jgi:hypothetical protein
MQAQVQNMLDKVVIRGAARLGVLQLFFSLRKSRWKAKVRFGVDFRALNAVIKFDHCSLPVLEETTSTLHGSKYFTVLDCLSCFWQLSIKEEHRERTGFAVRSYIMNSIAYTSAYLRAPRIFKERWTQS